MRKFDWAKRGDVVQTADRKYWTAIRPTGSQPGEGPDWAPAIVDDGPFYEAGPSGKDGRDGKDGVGKDGRDGVDGQDGDGFTYLGEWSPRKNYTVNSVVTLNGSSYVAIADSSRREPDESPRHWALMAAKGERGHRGEQGGAGQRGRSSIPLQMDILARLEEIEAGGSGGSELLPLIFDSVAVKGMAVFASSDGHADLAIATDHPGVIGLCNSDTVASGAAGLVNPDGVIDLEDWSSVTGSPLLNPGTVYYLSATTPGFITSTAPTTPGQYVVVLGRAISSTALAIEIDSPVLL